MTEVISKVQGMAELGALLRDLPTKVREKIIRAAMRKAGKDLLAEVQANVPVLTGALKESIKLSVGFSKRSQTMVATVMDTNPKGKLNSDTAWKSASLRQGGYDVFYGRFVEMGTRHAAAKPFMRPAMESQAATAIETLRSALETGIDKAVKS